jgi:glycoprotein endo-alpha-1,2-mannosidase
VAPVARSLIVCLLAALSLPAIALAAGPTVAAFYYPWYGTPTRDGMWIHWNQNNHVPPEDIASAYYPLLGPYSSDDPTVLATQMAEIKASGIDEIVSSWWGRGSFEDKRLPAVIAAAKLDGIAVAAHIEPYPGRTPASVVTDIWYLRTLGITTFYVFQPSAFTAAQWAPAMDTVHQFQALGVPAVVPAQVFVQTPLAGYAKAGHFDGVYTYDTLTYRGNELSRICTEAHAVALLCAPSVGPGYDAVRATGDPRIKPRRNGATYDSMWRAAIAAHPDLITITSFNEWHEGTQIEPAAPPARRAGYLYLGYEGAWGLHGVAAETSYLDRTAYWSKIFKAGAKLH